MRVNAKATVKPQLLHKKKRKSANGVKFEQLWGQSLHSHVGGVKFTELLFCLKSPNVLFLYHISSAERSPSNSSDRI